MLQAVQFLLQHGAKINETDDYGNNALDEATCDKMIELLKSYGATEIKKTCSMSDVAGMLRFSFQLKLFLTRIQILVVF